MERKYFPIDEESARMAHEMMYSDNYQEGITTAMYRISVDRAYNMADDVAEEKPGEAERAYRLAELYSLKLAEYYNKQSSIGMMCPFPPKCEPENFPDRKRERQLAATDRNRVFYVHVQGLLMRIKSILHRNDIFIMSKDELAIRMKEEDASNEDLREKGYSEEEIEILTMYSMIAWVTLRQRVQ